MGLEPLSEFEITLEGDNGTTVTRTVDSDETIDIASLIDNGNIDSVTEIDVDVAGSTEKSNVDVADGDTVSVDDGDLQGGNILDTATIFGVSGEIPDQGSISDLTPGESATSGYYDGGTVPSGGIDVGELSLEKKDEATEYNISDTTLSLTVNQPGVLATIVYVNNDKYFNISGDMGTELFSLFHKSGGEYRRRVYINLVDSGTYEVSLETADGVLNSVERSRLEFYTS